MVLGGSFASIVKAVVSWVIRVSFQKGLLLGDGDSLRKVKGWELFLLTQSDAPLTAQCVRGLS